MVNQGWAMVGLMKGLGCPEGWVLANQGLARVLPRLGWAMVSSGWATGRLRGCTGAPALSTAASKHPSAACPAMQHDRPRSTHNKRKQSRDRYLGNGDGVIMGEGVGLGFGPAEAATLCTVTIRLLPPSAPGR